MKPIESDDKIFTAGNPATGAKGTSLSSEWLNNVQNGLRDAPMSQFGAAGDTTTNDLPAFELAAESAVEFGGAVILETGNTYMLDAAKPRLQDYGARIMAKPGAKIRLLDPNPSIKETQILTEIGTHGDIRTYHRNFNRDTLLASLGAAAATSCLAKRKARVTTFGTPGDWNKYSISSRWTTTASTIIIGSAQSIYWSTAATTSEGVFRDITTSFESAEVTFLDLNNVVSGDKRAEIHIVGDQRRYICSLRESDPNLVITKDTGATLVSISLPNTNNYTIGPVGSCTVRLRILDKRYCEIYINDLAVYTLDITAQDSNTVIQHYGFGCSSGWGNTEISLINAIIYSGEIPITSKGISLSVIGDSLSYGAFATIDWPTHLSQILLALPNGGNATVTNHAVSSSSTQTWIDGATYTGDGSSTYYKLSEKDFTGDDYVCVLLGTNDCQSALSHSGTFLTNLGTIRDKIINDGARPIFGIPPVFTTGAGRSFPQNIARYQSVIRKFCMDNNYPIAEVSAAFGNNTDLYVDGIHPSEVGQILIAHAFASAIVNDGPKRVSPTMDVPLTPVVTYSNSWVAYGSAGYRDASYELKAGIVSLTGNMKSGTVGTTGTYSFVLPVGLRPSENLFFTVSTWNGSVFASGVVLVKTTGAVEVWSGGNSWVSLSGISFTA